MNIAWSPEAIEDLVSLRAYISEDNPAAARRAVLHIIKSIEELLPDNPNIGRAGRVPGTREFVIPRTPYIVPYRSKRTTIQILRIYHGGTALARWTLIGRIGAKKVIFRRARISDPEPRIRSFHFLDFSISGCRSRTPGPPPFSSMNSTPAASKARRTARQPQSRP